MKKIYILMAIIFLISACQKSVKKVGLFLYNAEDLFMTNLNQEILDKPVIENNKVYSFDGQNSQVLQNEQLESMLKKGADLIIINPVDRLGAHALIKKLKAQNIPVIFFNREPLENDLKLWDKCYYVGANAEQSGQMQAQLLIELFGNNPGILNKYDRNGDGRIQSVIIRGEQSHQDSEIRTRVVIQTFKEQGFQLDVLTFIVANWNREEAYEKMSEVLDSYQEEIEVIISNNDAMAIGAIRKMQERGFFMDANGNGRIDKDDTDWIPVVGIDGIQEAMDLIERGLLYGTVINDADSQAKAIVELADSILNKRDFDNGDFTLVNGIYIWCDYLPYRSVQ